MAESFNPSQWGAVAVEDSPESWGAAPVGQSAERQPETFSMSSDIARSRKKFRGDEGMTGMLDRWQQEFSNAPIGAEQIGRAHV